MSTLERRLPWIIVGLAAAAGILGFWLSHSMFNAGSANAAPQLRHLQASMLYPQPRPLPDFVLQRSDGSSLTQADWRGHWRLVFFGFTHCPEICPTTLSTLKAVNSKLSELRPESQLKVSFISVDPERDLPEALGKYIAFFDPQFEAATGTDAALQRLARPLQVVYVKEAHEPGAVDYNVDHSTSIWIINPQGRVAGLMRPPHLAPAILADLIELLDSPTEP